MKYAVLSDNSHASEELIGTDNADYFTIHTGFPEDVSEYHKELLCIVGHFAQSKQTAIYASLEKCLRKWKQLRPDGEIHMIGHMPPAHFTPTPQVSPLVDKFNETQHQGESYLDLVPAIIQHWPQYALAILSDKAKKA